MLLPKKDLIYTSGVGKINNYYEDTLQRMKHMRLRWLQPQKEAPTGFLAYASLKRTGKTWQVEDGCLVSIYLLTTSHTYLLTTPTSHTHRFHPLSKIVIHTSAHKYCTEVWMTILESGWNLWVWLVGVVMRWVWLVVRRYIDILSIINNFPYSTCISFFGGQQQSYFFVQLKNVFSVFIY